MSVDVINLSEAKKKSYRIPGEIFEAVKGISDNEVVPLDGRYLDFSKYSKLPCNINNTLDTMLYPDKILNSRVELLQGIKSITDVIPTSIQIYQAREPDQLVILAVTNSTVANPTTASTVTFIKINKNTRVVTLQKQLTLGVNRGFTTFGYAFIGVNEYIGIRIGNASPDSYVFHTNNNWTSTTQGNYPALWGNAEIQALSNNLLVIPAYKLTAGAVNIKFSDVPTLSTSTNVTFAPRPNPLPFTYILPRTVVWNDAVYLILGDDTGKGNAIICATKNKTIYEVTGNLTPKSKIISMCTTKDYLVVVTDDGEIWYTASETGNTTDWTKATDTIGKGLYSGITKFENNTVIVNSDKTASFVFNIDTKNIRLMDCGDGNHTGGLVFTDSTDGLLTYIACVPNKYYFNPIIAKFTDYTQNNMLDKTILHINNEEELGANHFLHKCIRGLNNEVILVTSSTASTVKSKVESVPIYISKDNGKTWDIRYFNQKLSTAAPAYIRSITTYNNKYYIVVTFIGSSSGIYSSPDLVTWTLETSANTTILTEIDGNVNGVVYSGTDTSAQTSTARKLPGNAVLLTKTVVAAGTLHSIACSDDGQFIVVPFSNNVISVSNNSGTSFTDITIPGSRTFGCNVSQYDPISDCIFVSVNDGSNSMLCIKRDKTSFYLDLNISTSLQIESIYRHKNRVYFDSSLGMIFYVEGSSFTATSKVYLLQTGAENILTRTTVFTTLAPDSNGPLISSIHLNGQHACKYIHVDRTIESEQKLHRVAFSWKQIGKLNGIANNAVCVNSFNINNGKYVITTGVQGGAPVSNYAIYKTGIMVNVPGTYSNWTADDFISSIYLSTSVDYLFLASKAYPDKIVVSGREKFNTDGVYKSTLGVDFNHISYIGKSTSQIQDGNTGPYRITTIGGQGIACYPNTKTVYIDAKNNFSTMPTKLINSNFSLDANEGGIATISYGKNSFIIQSSNHEIAYNAGDSIISTWTLTSQFKTIMSRQPTTTASSRFTNPITFLEGSFIVTDTTINNMNATDGYTAAPTDATDIVVSSDGLIYSKISTIPVPFSAKGEVVKITDYYVVCGQTVNDSGPSMFISKDLIKWYQAIILQDYFTNFSDAPIFTGAPIELNTTSGMHETLTRNGDIYANSANLNIYGGAWKKLKTPVNIDNPGAILYSNLTKLYYIYDSINGIVYKATDIFGTWSILVSQNLPTSILGDVVITITDKYLTFKLYNITENTTKFAFIDLTNNNVTTKTLPAYMLNLHEVVYLPGFNNWVIFSNRTGSANNIFKTTDFITFTEITLPKPTLHWAMGQVGNTVVTHGYYSDDNMVTWKTLKFNGEDYSGKIRQYIEMNKMGSALVTTDIFGQIYKTTNGIDLIRCNQNIPLDYTIANSGGFSISIVGYSDFDNYGILSTAYTTLITTDGINYVKAPIPLESGDTVVSATVSDTCFVVITNYGEIFYSKQFIKDEIPKRMTIPLYTHPSEGMEYYLLTGVKAE